MRNLVKFLVGAMVALAVLLPGCMASFGSSRTPYGNQTSIGVNGLGIVGFNLNASDSVSAYNACLESHAGDTSYPGFNSVEAYCFQRTGMMSGGMPYSGAFTGAWGSVMSPSTMGGSWVQTSSGPRYVSGGASVYQGTALDPLMAPAVMQMEMARRNALNTTTERVREAIATYPNQSTPNH